MYEMIRLPLAHKTILIRCISSENSDQIQVGDDQASPVTTAGPHSHGYGQPEEDSVGAHGDSEGSSTFTWNDPAVL